MPSINDDEELARALQEEYEREASRSRQRRQQQQQFTPPPATAPHEERRRRQSRPSNVTTPTANVEADEQLARRLEQEMKDEELARRLSASTENLNAPARPRPSASTLMQSNSRRDLYSAGTPVADPVVSPRSSRRSSSQPRSVRPNSAHNSHRRERRSRSSGRRESSSRRDRHGSSSSSNRRSSDGTARRSSSTSNQRSSSEASSRGDRRRGTRPSSSSRRRSSDWTRSNSGGENQRPSTRQQSIRRSSSHNSSSGQSSNHSLSRGRGSAVSPAVEPDYALPVTSVDPPLVAATIVQTPNTMSTSVSQQNMMDSYGIPDDTEPDVELAMRLAQEERDAALAQELERCDQEIASRNASRLATAISSGPRRRWTCRRIAGAVVPLVLIAGAAVVVMLLVAGRGDLSGIPNIFDDDPFAGNPDDASRWKNKGNGLNLEVVNALQEQWWNNFNIAMDEWDAGTPDALTLSRSTAEYDYDCKAIQGKMKVCNGDYGDTRWKGVNQVLLSGGWIISSTAKLNEYYLAGASEAQRQYTTCHEIGHGFGLPHTDEDFYNRDLGNCMDYTNNPDVNKSPDESNYQFLLDLYGPAPQRRDLKGFLQADGDFDEEFLDLYMDTVHKMEFEDTQHGVMWNLLHRNTHGEFFSADLGNNYTVEVHVLLAD